MTDVLDKLFKIDFALRKFPVLLGIDALDRDIDPIKPSFNNFEIFFR